MVILSRQNASIDQFVRNSIVSKNTNKAILNFETSSETMVTVQQSVKLRIIGNDIKISNIGLSNNAVLDMKLISDLAGEINLDFINELKTAVRNDLDSTLEQGLGFLGNPFGSQASAIRSTVQNEATNIIENEIEINNIKSFFTNLQVNQDNELIVQATGFVDAENITLDNNYQIELVSQQIMSDFMSAVLENEAVNDVMTSEVAYLEQRADGVNDVIDSVGGVFKNLFSGLFAPLIIIAVVIAVVVVVFLVIKNSKSKSGMPQGTSQQAPGGSPDFPPGPSLGPPPGPPPGPPLGPYPQDPGQLGPPIGVV